MAVFPRIVSLSLFSNECHLGVDVATPLFFLLLALYPEAKVHVWAIVEGYFIRLQNCVDRVPFSAIGVLL